METGLKYTSTCIVARENTAAALGSGDLAVFATPAMAALMENAAMCAVAQELDASQTTVGTALNITHIKASAIGSAITATAELMQIDARKLTFKVQACDNNGTIGEGEHIRYVVDREKFMSKIL